MDWLLDVLACKRRSRLSRAVQQVVSGAQGHRCAGAGAHVSSKKRPKACLTFPTLGLLKDAPEESREELLLQKLKACNIVYDFYSSERPEDKEAKRATLQEIVEYVSESPGAFQEPLFAEMIEMVGKNIVRVMPERQLHPLAPLDLQDTDPQWDPAWVHLQSIYDFFLRFVISDDVNPKVAKKYLLPCFIQGLVDNFESEDPRERDYLKTILHRFYGKFVSLRSHVRNAVERFFFKFVYEVETHAGIADLLEVMGSIINGFSVPLKADNRDFLSKALLPLQRSKSLKNFYPQFSFCMTQYVMKDISTAKTIFMSVLRCWPHQVASKQVLFLNTIESVIDSMEDTSEAEEWEDCMHNIFTLVGKCLRHPHFHVSERAHLMWSNDGFETLVKKMCKKVYPLVIPALVFAQNDHWNSIINGMAREVLSKCEAKDARLVERYSAGYKEAVDDNPAAAQELRLQRWNVLRDLAIARAKREGLPMPDD
eukprot:TRINITY_DN8022_c0_g1_i2.p1 TRINITY_DN8022_c0_g1~~TRINITY_DN8022_c0_g1_i2.p1  ORF type:complete len:482 (-),score=103.90 TRINITY_DN8022_c0_g1_i2:96-1541(-)